MYQLLNRSVYPSVKPRSTATFTSPTSTKPCRPTTRDTDPVSVGELTTLDPCSQSLDLLRQKENRIFNDSCRLQKSKMSFNVDAASLWNVAPMSIRNAVSSYKAKKYINEFVKTLPL